jgi:hypothetical protein
MISEKQVWAALPSSGFLRNYVEWGTKWTGAPAGFHAVAGLCLLAQTVPVSYAFPWASPLRANFYGLLIGPSGAGGKGRSISAARDTITAAAIPAEMEQPGSPEGCVEALEGKPQVIFYDEFGDFLERTRQGQLGGLRTIYTNLFDCVKVGRRLVDRPGKKKKEPEPNPRLSLLAGVTPTFLEEYTRRVDWEGGFMSRFFMLYSSSDRNPPVQFTGAEMQTYLAQVLAGFAADGKQRGGESVDLFNLGLSSKCGGWSAAAEPLWEEWQRSLDRRRAAESPLAGGAIQRSAAYGAKISLLLAWDEGTARRSGEWRVSEETLRYAIALTELHIQSSLEIVSGLAFDRDARDERDMYRAIGVGPTEHSVALRRSGLSARRGAEMIASLSEKGLIRYFPGLDGVTRYSSTETPSNVLPFRRPGENEEAIEPDPPPRE